VHAKNRLQITNRGAIPDKAQDYHNECLEQLEEKEIKARRKDVETNRYKYYMCVCVWRSSRSEKER